MVGLSQAIALAQEGVDVVLVDREDFATQTLPSFDGRVSAIAWKSYKFLEQIGVWDEMKKEAQPILDIRVSEGSSPLFLHFDHEEIGDDPFGYIVENRHTRVALVNRARQLPNLKIIAPAEVSALSIEHSSIEILQKNHAPCTMHYGLLIGADGKASKVRSLLGIETTGHEYNQHGIVCTIEHEKPHAGLAYEKFLPKGPFAVLPMTGNRSSLVWSEPSELAPIYMSMPEEEFMAEMKKRVDYLGDLKLVGKRWCYKLDLIHAKKYVSGNVVLIGDAAHGIHPIAGQGVNLGFRDAIKLTEIIVRNRKLGLPVDYNLGEYESYRRWDNNLMIAATDLLNRLFSNRSKEN